MQPTPNGLMYYLPINVRLRRYVARLLILNDVQSLRRTTSFFTGAVSASIQKDPGTWDKVVNANDWFTDSNIVIAKRGLFRFAVPVEAYRGAAGRSQQLGKSNRAKVGERHVNHATQRESQCEIILF